MRARILVVLVVMAVALAACGGAGGVGVGQATGGTLRLAHTVDEGTLTPFTYVTGRGIKFMSLIYDTLLVEDENHEPQPLLATAFEISDDGLTYRLPLHEGVTWHDGEPFTTADVLFSFDFYANGPENGWKSLAQAAESVTAEGNTVVLKLSEPKPDYLLTPLSEMMILPRHVWGQVEDPEAAPVEAAIGTGPYRLVEYRKDQSYRFAANEDWALGTPSLDEIVVPVITEEQTAFAALRSGEIDAVTTNLPAQLVEQFKQAEGIELIPGTGYASQLLQFNIERAPFDVVEVRQAIGLAIDLQPLVDTVFLGQATPGNPGFLHPDSPLAGTPPTHVYDPDAANELLDGLGYAPGPDGTRVAPGKPMTFTLLVYSNAPERIRMAELIKEMLAQIGVGIEIQTLEMAAADELIWPGFDVAMGRDFDMAMWGWSAPVSLLSERFAGLVHSDPRIGYLDIGGFRNAEADALAEEMTRTVDLQERIAVAGQLQQLLAEQRPFVTLLYEDPVYAFRPEAYDGFTYLSGDGIVHKLSFASPAEPTPSRRAVTLQLSSVYGGKLHVKYRLREQDRNFPAYPKESCALPEHHLLPGGYLSRSLRVTFSELCSAGCT